MVTLSCQPWLTSMEKKAEVTFEGITYSSLVIINKEELLGEWQVIKKAFSNRKGYGGVKNISPPSLQDIKTTIETSYACIFQEIF